MVDDPATSARATATLFAGFDPARVADVRRRGRASGCLADAGIVRNRAKINAAIGNARAWLELDDPVAFLWSFVDGAPVQNRWATLGDVPATTPAAEAMSKALKRRGFRFVGPTICYALMQSCGLVNDHVTIVLPPRRGARSPASTAQARRSEVKIRFGTPAASRAPRRPVN